jgi:hypothetical protein
MCYGDHRLGDRPASRRQGRCAATKRTTTADSPVDSIRSFPAPLSGLRQTVRLSGVARRRAGTAYRVVAGAAVGAGWKPPRGPPSKRPRRATRPCVLWSMADMRAPGHAASRAGGGRHRARTAADDPEHRRPWLATGSEESAWQKYFVITGATGGESLPVGASVREPRGSTGWDWGWRRPGACSVSPPSHPSPDTPRSIGAEPTSSSLDSNHLDRPQRDWLASDLGGGQAAPCAGNLRRCATTDPGLMACTVALT